MKWNIIADSSCDLFALEGPAEGVSFSTVPFVISVDSTDYVDDERLDTPGMVTAMEKSRQACRTSCPFPNAWYDLFMQPGHVIAVTISGRLSGSWNSANAAREMALEACPDKKIAVIDSRSTGPEIILIVRKICEAIASGADFDAVVKSAEDLAERTHIVFALSSFNNLVKNGRMSRIAGFLAGKLHLWGIGVGSEEGTIRVKHKVRGARMALEAIVQDIKERRERPGEIVISHCLNRELAETLKDSIERLWNSAKVQVVPTRGLCSFYAERGGLIVAF